MDKIRPGRITDEQVEAYARATNAGDSGALQTIREGLAAAYVQRERERRVMGREARIRERVRDLPALSPASVGEVADEIARFVLDLEDGPARGVAGKVLDRIRAAMSPAERPDVMDRVARIREPFPDLLDEIASLDAERIKRLEGAPATEARRVERVEFAPAESIEIRTGDECNCLIQYGKQLCTDKCPPMSEPERTEVAEKFGARIGDETCSARIRDGLRCDLPEHGGVVHHDPIEGDWEEV